MPKKLNSYILSDNLIEIMKQQLLKTENIRKEVGFNLCKIEGTDELKDDIHCTGSSCEINLKGKCNIGNKVGNYHTHPGNGAGISTPSISDIDHAYFYGLVCIGGLSDKKINCFIRKDKTANSKDIQLIRYYRNKFKSLDKPHITTSKKGSEMLKAKFKERKYTREKLTNNYFYKVEII